MSDEILIVHVCP